MPSLLLQTKQTSVLALADGAFYLGQSIGFVGKSVGEVVFNTSMTGYQEILTDPSYQRQLVTLTYPHIGNYGINPEDGESANTQAAGLIIRDLSLIASNFRSTSDLANYLMERQVVSIAGIDTRALTRRLRTNGAQNGCILSIASGQVITQQHIDEATQAARAAPSMSGVDLAKEVTCAEPKTWTEGEWVNDPLVGKTAFQTDIAQPLHVVALDFGVKRNILRMLAQRGCKITVLPAQTDASAVFALKPDGIFLSNGPGDPAACDYAIIAAKAFIESGIPVFGICLGHQILSLACGAQTFKMKFGHHGGNHPVKDVKTGRVSITSQNHGFAVDEKTLPANLRTTHISLFDGTVQGIERTDKPVFGFQGHPEASPGPHDIASLFDRFVDFMRGMVV